MNASSSNPTTTPSHTSPVPARAAGAATSWEVDPTHSTAAFKVRHLMVSNVRGALGPIEGTVRIDEGDLSRSQVDVRIDARGIETRDAKRDEHLRSADFLDVANHPHLAFRSTAVRQKGDHLEVTGELTIRGQTRPVTLQVDALEPAVNDPWGNVKRGATARTVLNRKEWGLGWNMALEAGGVVVGEQVHVELELELLQRRA